MRLIVFAVLLSVLVGAVVDDARSGSNQEPPALFALGGSLQLPRGAPNKVAPVAVMTTGGVRGPGGHELLSANQDVGFVLRNNTGSPVHDLVAEAVVVDSSGRPLSEVHDVGIEPLAVRTGGLAFGWFRLTNQTRHAYPAGSRIRITASGSRLPYVDRVDLRIRSARTVAATAGVVGVAENTVGRRIEGPLTVAFACFNRRNHLSALGWDIRSDIEWALPRQRVTFDEIATSWNSHELQAGGPACAHALIAVSGIR